MPYTINLTNGQQLTVVQDGTLDTTTSLTLAGANYVGYGQFLNENLVYLLENGANTAPPAHPLKGQLWFNTTTQEISVYTTTGFKALPTIINAVTQPGTGNAGDFWWDSLNYQLYIYSSGWQLIGPLYQQSMGVTGAIPTRIWDTNFPSNYHDCVTLQTGTAIGAIIHNGTASFSPSPAITGFTTIRPGINLNTSYTNLFNGTTTNSQLLGGLAPSAFYQLNTDLITTGNLKTSNQVNFGSGYEGTLSVDTNNVNLSAATKNITVKVAAGTALTANALTTLVTVSADPTANLGIATKQYVDVVNNNLQTELTSNVTALSMALQSNVSLLESLITTLQSAFNTNIGTINTTLGTVATTTYVNNAISAALPMGVIIGWKGTPGNVPSGYHLCDGTNGTPDFRNKFIVGAGDTYSAGSTGGSTTATLQISNLPGHTHTFSGTVNSAGTGTTDPAGAHVHGLSDPEHSHIFPGDDQLGAAAGRAGWGGASAGGFPYDAVSQLNGGGQMWYTTVSSTGIAMSGVADHQHNFSTSVSGSFSGTTGSTGSASSFGILPPYYAMCWIMKIV